MRLRHASLALASSAVMAAALLAPAARAGVMYVSDYSSTVDTVPSGGGAANVFASGLYGPFAIAFDAAGDLHIANQFGNSVSEAVDRGFCPSAAPLDADRPPSSAVLTKSSPTPLRIGAAVGSRASGSRRGAG